MHCVCPIPYCLIPLSYSAVNVACYSPFPPPRRLQVYHPEDLPRVYFQETDKHDLVMRNLSLTRVGTEEEALELMWQGDEKRAEAK